MCKHEHFLLSVLRTMLCSWLGMFNSGRVHQSRHSTNPPLRGLLGVTLWESPHWWFTLKPLPFIFPFSHPWPSTSLFSNSFPFLCSPNSRLLLLLPLPVFASLSYPRQQLLRGIKTRGRVSLPPLPHHFCVSSSSAATHFWAFPPKAVAHRLTARKMTRAKHREGKGWGQGRVLWLDTDCYLWSSSEDVSRSRWNKRCDYASLMENISASLCWWMNVSSAGTAFTVWLVFDLTLT